MSHFEMDGNEQKNDNNLPCSKSLVGLASIALTYATKTDWIVN